MGTLTRKVAIVGVDESDRIGRLGNVTSLQLHIESARNALNDAGIKKEDVDGLCAAGPYSTLATGEYLGIHPKFTDCTSVGGSSFVIHLEHAAAAIAAGLCEVVLVTHGESGHSNRTRRGMRGGVDPTSPGTQFESPFGAVGPPATYSMACMRHMFEYGTTHEHLGEIAVATRKWAQLNPKALMRDPMTMDDYMNSRWVSYPFHLLDCCLVTDAGGAYVVTTPERAKDCKKAPVWLLGSGEYHDHASILQMPSLSTMPARVSGQLAFERAGVSRDDIDVALIYDSFTYTVLVSLEDLGFCKKGEGGAFVSGQRTAPGGDFPMNTNGGGLSYTHSGMYGMFTILETVRQLRGECGERQVKDCKIALAHGTGGTLSSGGTVILGRD
ncbi:MAG: thiolase [Candidatus Tectomicrobia bacterium]|nr:thiolase [Candidatus Tectomicrobia bacterium]